MKKLFTLVIAVAAVLPSWASRPLLVGHRGSDIGVENTVQSFTEGAKRGYEYLETDFKVTKDLKLVCTHDDDTQRLGDKTLTIASSTLDELQGVNLTQTRGGVKYTGRLASAQEYLDVCKEYGVKPLIELKWATGINSNDCSNIPILIKLVEDNGFRNSCIIMTSMKPCLEYIRKNYPDIELQFLTGQYWANHFDWCVKWGIDADIQATYFDKSTVQKYHDAGLKVNMWTTNNDEGYLQYGNWGCDFITTDKLDPKALPELDPNRFNGPNTVDYPAVNAPVKGAYQPEKVAEFDAPLAGLTVRRAVLIDGVWHVLAADAAGTQSISRIDAATGKLLGTMNLQGITARIGDIAATADGVLLASTVATVPFAADGNDESVFRVYSWADSSAAAEVLIAVNKAEAVLGNWSNALCGEVMAVSGMSRNLKLYVSTRSASGSTYRIAGLKVERGSLVEAEASYCYDPAYTAANWGDFSITVTPTSRNNILIDSPVMQPTEYAFNWEQTRQPLTLVAAPAEGILANGAIGMSFHRRAAKVYALVPSVDANGANFSARLYNATDGLAALSPVSPKLHEGLGTAPMTAAATGFQITDAGTFMHIFAAGQGMASFALNAEPVEEPVETVDLELTRDWILSNTTGNHPGNIDGTNAQQGTAVNGLFYVNNCVDKKIYVFDSKGLMGSMPGGAGWGCARDDAGNILVRNDKATGAEHSFILYPAGCTPANPGTPIEFSAVSTLAGQVNFINASGDLYNGTGYIYLFPNKQTAVSVIAVEKGAVTGATTSAELKMAGTTAGYVVPQSNDPENFLYQVRGTGVQIYNGGASTALFPDRQGTTVPARNSTGGTAYFKLRGNQIYAHSSGANYKGGFTVRNMSVGDATRGTVVGSFDPIGSLGYETGGNYSTFNWLIPEKVDEGTYKLYQYCPANGIAVYTLRDKNFLGVSDIATGDDAQASIAVSCSAGTLTISGVEVDSAVVYSLAGIQVAAFAGNTADVSALTPGAYVVRVNGTHSAKFLKN